MRFVQANPTKNWIQYNPRKLLDDQLCFLTKKKHKRPRSKQEKMIKQQRNETQKIRSIKHGAQSSKFDLPEQSFKLFIINIIECKYTEGITSFQ